MSNTIRTFKTNKGTELPLLNLRGKDYLEVKYRLVWFREEHPQWTIETSYLTIDENSACARAVIRDESGRIIATSHKTESSGNFPDFMEKAETGAIGRALALIGYGTQFCADELDEGDRIVDAPASPRSKNKNPTDVTKLSVADLGNFMVNFGKKYLGKRLKDIPRDEIEAYIEWLESNAEKKKMGLTPEAKVLKHAVEKFFHPERWPHPSEEENPEPLLQNNDSPTV